MAGNIWDQYVEANARRFGVPPALVQSVISAESGGRQNAVSPKGAGGYMQIMPNTYAELRQQHGLGEDRFDPANNIAGGTAYLAQLHKQFGNWEDAVAAYNAGPGRVAKVKAGQATLPPETQAYVPKVMAKFGDQGTDMAIGQRRTTAGMTEADMLELSRNGTMPRPGSGGLLDVPPEKNFLDGLGGIWNAGQTPSQPPAPRGGVEKLPTQTERLDVTGRMNELMQGLLAPQTRGPSLTPGQYQLAGAGEAVGQLAGVTNRRVGIGEILGALGGGLTRGALAGERAQQERLGNEFDRLGKFATIQGQQRTADLNERNSVFDNQYKQALTQAALNKGDDPKVVGEGIYENGVWKPAPWAKGNGAGGPFEGNSIDAQMYNIVTTLGQKQANGQPLTPQETYMLDLAKRHLTAPKQMMGPEGLSSVAPSPLPQFGGGPGPQTAPTPAPAPQPGLLDPTAPPPAAAPPPATVTTTQGGPTVTTLVPNKLKDIPATTTNELLELTNALRKAEDGEAEVKKAPDSTGPGLGLANQILPGDTLNWFQPGGANARASIADIGSLKIHDRSGAAVTVSEFPRLAPFVPQVGDNPETVKMKLKRFREELVGELKDRAALFNAEQGYRPNPILEGVMKTGRAPRYNAPISGDDPNNPAATGQGGVSGLSDADLLKQLGLSK